MKKSDKDWKSTSPSESKIDSTLLTPVLESVVGVAIQEFASDTDLAKYGLDNPKYSITIGSKDSKKTLLLGNDKSKDVATYAMIEGKNEVFVIGADIANSLGKELKDFIAK